MIYRSDNEAAESRCIFQEILHLVPGFAEQIFDLGMMPNALSQLIRIVRYFIFGIGNHCFYY
jgi:hypothetical protein